MVRLAIALSTLLLAGCGTTKVQLPYTPTAAVSSTGTPTAGLAEVVDQRGEGADWLGAVRGGYGNPTQTVRTDRPVRDVVQQAFGDALAARGLLAPAGSQRHDVRVIVHQLDCNRYMTPQANADFAVEVVDRATQRVVYADRAKVKRDEGGLFSGGMFGSADELRALTNRAQNQAIDQLLDKPGFLAALRPTGAPRRAA